MYVFVILYCLFTVLYVVHTKVVIIKTELQAGLPAVTYLWKFFIMLTSDLHGQMYLIIKNKSEISVSYIYECKPLFRLQTL